MTQRAAKVDTTTLIERYLEAYRAANGDPGNLTVEYKGGWFVFHRGWRKTGAYRRAKFEGMTNALIWRASPDGQQYFKANP